MARLPCFRFWLQPMENLPTLPELTLKDEQLVSRRRHLESAWNVSPYYIEKPKPKAVGVAAEIERYSDRYKLSVQTKRPPLGSVLKLAPAYFPAELLGQGNRARNNQTSGAQWTLQSAAGRNDLQRLDHLATLEQKRLKDEDDKDDGNKEEKKKKEGEDGDGDDDDEVVEDEEEEFGDDDYAQNFGFDDDEDYLDMDDGGGDDGMSHAQYGLQNSGLYLAVFQLEWLEVVCSGEWSNNLISSVTLSMMCRRGNLLVEPFQRHGKGHELEGSKELHLKTAD